MERGRFLLDLDGVIYRGDTALPGAPELVRWLDAAGHAWACVTNNAVRTPEEVAAKLAGMGISAGPERIVTSAVATAEWLARQAPEGARVLPLGGPGLVQALLAPGSRFTPDWRRPDWVAAGQDFEMTYGKLAAACLALGRGARLVLTNPDVSFPTEGGLTPGAGAWAAVLTLVTGVEPSAVIGKPEPSILEMALGLLPPVGRVVVVGDRLDTDILAGQRIGATTALVLTGVSTREEAERGPVCPDRIVADLHELVRVMSDE